MQSHRGGETTRAREAFDTVSRARRLTFETVTRLIFASYSPPACRKMADFVRVGTTPHKPNIRLTKTWHEQDASNNWIGRSRRSTGLANANDGWCDHGDRVGAWATARAGGSRRPRAGKTHV